MKAVRRYRRGGGALPGVAPFQCSFASRFDPALHFIVTLLGRRYRKFVNGIFATKQISSKCKAGSKCYEVE